MTTTKKLWDQGELIAIKYLQKKWYNILDTNYKFWRFWEIDLIVQKEKITHFIEVKYRTNSKYGSPEESITKSKLHKLQKSIYAYCFKKRIDIESIQFDVIAIVKNEKSYRLKHYKNVEI